MKITNLPIFFIALFGFLCAAQTSPFTQYNTSSILPNNTVRALYVAHDGALWIGTDNGLVRKYNTTINSYFKEDGLPLNNIWAITEDANNELWVGTYGEGIAHYDGEKFTKISSKQGLIHNEITHLFNFQNNLYIGTSNGVSIVSTASKKVIASTKATTDEVIRSSGFFEFNKEVYVTTYSSGIFKLSRKGNHVDLQKISDHSFIYAAHQRNDSLYLSNKKYISVFAINDVINKKIIAPRIIENQSIVWDYVETDKETLYGGAWGIFEDDGGLIRFNKSLTNSSKISELPSSAVLSLSYDNLLKNLYVGTKDAGLFEFSTSSPIEKIPSSQEKMVDISYFKNQSIQLFTSGLQINGKFINSSFFKEKQINYVRNNQNKLPKYEDFFYELEYDTPAEKIVFYNIKTSEDALWINTSIGLYKFSPYGAFESYLPLHTLVFDFGPSDELIETNPYHGLRVYNNDEKLDYTYYPSTLLSTPTDVVSTLKGKNKTYLLSVFKGLFTYDGTFKSLLATDVWKEKKLRHITELENNIAVSNEAGDVFIIDDTKNTFNVIRTIHQKEIRGNTIFFLNHYKGWLIVATEKGITFSSGKRQLFINEEQGIKNPVYASTIYNDQLLLASEFGKYTIDLNKLLNTPNKIDGIFITSLNINDSIVSNISPRLQLEYTENNLSIAMETNAHPFPQKLTYYYRINENSSWQKSNNQKIDLRFLKPGAYNINVRVNDAYTGQLFEGQLLSFTIALPFYLKWWFLLLTGLFLMALVYLYFNRIRKRQLIQYALEIATTKHIEELKTEALLAQMNPHFIFNALNSIQHLVMTNENERASVYLNKFSKLVRANLNNAQRPFTSLREELDYLKVYCEIENERHANRIAIVFNIDSQINPSEVEIPTLILQPFLENAFVHAFPSSILSPMLELTVTVFNAHLISYEIKDNGIGALSKLKRSTTTSKGISLIKERLHFLNYDVETSLNVDYSENGSTITLLL